MDKKKVFGIPLALFVLGVIVIGGASAALVTYLSNTAQATVTVSSPMTVEFSDIIGEVDSNGTFQSSTWDDTLTMSDSTALGTSLVGVRVHNKADVAIEGKVLKLTVSNSLGNVGCSDISKLEFMDTATEIQIAKGYQDLTPLCHTNGTTAVYNIDIHSLAPGQIYVYPAKITYGAVEPAVYTFDAQMIMGE